jgi:hypothetical protein
MLSPVPRLVLRLCMLIGVMILMVDAINYSLGAYSFIHDRLNALQVAFQSD